MIFLCYTFISDLASHLARSGEISGLGGQFHFLRELGMYGKMMCLVC